MPSPAVVVEALDTVTGLPCAELHSSDTVTPTPGLLAVFFEALDTVTGLPCASLRSSDTVTPTPGLIEAMLPVIVLLNWVMLTCGRGSGLSVLLVPWTQALSSIDHMSCSR